VLIACGGWTVWRNLRDHGDKSEEPSRVRVVFVFGFAVDFETYIVLENISLKWCYYS
jgi:hypothetical protein